MADFHKLESKPVLLENEFFFLWSVWPRRPVTGCEDWGSGLRLEPEGQDGIEPGIWWRSAGAVTLSSVAVVESTPNEACRWEKEGLTGHRHRKSCPLSPKSPSCPPCRPSGTRSPSSAGAPHLPRALPSRPATVSASQGRGQGWNFSPVTCVKTLSISWLSSVLRQLQN